MDNLIYMGLINNLVYFTPHVASMFASITRRRAAPVDCSGIGYINITNIQELQIQMDSKTL